MINFNGLILAYKLDSRAIIIDSFRINEFGIMYFMNKKSKSSIQNLISPIIFSYTL